MNRFRVHLDTLGVLVVLVALDASWYVEFVRHGYNHPSVFGFSDRGFDGSVLPMLTVLAVGSHHVLFHRGRAPFLVGFVAAGWFATLAFMAWTWVDPESLGRALIVRPFPGLVQALRRGRISVQQFLWIGGAIDGALQLAVALLGGGLALWRAAGSSRRSRAWQRTSPCSGR